VRCRGSVAGALSGFASAADGTPGIGLKPLMFMDEETTGDYEADKRNFWTAMD
jgi:hypothetical protein